MKKITVLTYLLLCCFLSCFAQEIVDKHTALHTNLNSEIGAVIAAYRKVKKTEAVKITKSFEFKSGFFKFQFKKEDIYPLVKTKKDYKIFYLKSNWKDGRHWGIAINENNSDLVYSALISSIGWVKVRKKKNYKEFVEKTELTELCTTCYSQEFLFNGSKGTILSFTYREFIGNVARPSFFQSVEYDIQKSNIIGFKGLRLKILEHTNTFIKYEILKPFTPIN